MNKKKISVNEAHEVLMAYFNSPQGKDLLGRLVPLSPGLFPGRDLYGRRHLPCGLPDLRRGQRHGGHPFPPGLRGVHLLHGREPPGFLRFRRGDRDDLRRRSGAYGVEDHHQAHRGAHPRQCLALSHQVPEDEEARHVPGGFHVRHPTARSLPQRFPTLSTSLTLSPSMMTIPSLLSPRTPTVRPSATWRSPKRKTEHPQTYKRPASEARRRVAFCLIL